MRRYLLPFLIASLCWSVACLALAKPQSSQTPKKNKPIVVKASSPELIIRLPSNPTTGYSWFLVSYQNHLVIPISREYQAPTSKMPGAPGQSVWRFQFKKSAFIVPHIIKIHMLYARSFDLTNTREKVITIMTR